jgi:hypothetical protein
MSVTDHKNWLSDEFDDEMGGNELASTVNWSPSWRNGLALQSELLLIKAIQSSRSGLRYHTAR